MRSFTTKLCALGGTVAAALTLSTGSPALSQTPNAPVPTLYAADLKHDAVVLFPAGVARPKPFGKITDGISKPQSLFVDRGGTLYVANSGSASITEYARGTRSPVKRVLLHENAPYDVAAAPDGSLYVALIHRVTHQCSLWEYAPGATEPQLKINFYNMLPMPTCFAGLTVDASTGDIYIGFGSSSGGGGYGVDAYVPGALHPFARFSYGTVEDWGGLEIDARERLFVGAPPDHAVYVAQLPSRMQIQKIHTPAFASDLTLDEAANLLYTTSYLKPALDIIDLRTGKLLDSIPGYGSGVAVDPPSF